MKFPRLLLLFVILGASATRVPAAEESPAAVGRAMTDAAQAFLKGLSPEERARVRRAFDEPARKDWHNIPKPERKGLQIREMTQTQRTLCHDLLRAGLSESGYEKAVRIMSLESNLHEGEKNLKNSPLRDPERYFITLFGAPELKGEWGWSFEGHHLSLNFVIRDGEVVAETPSFWGANPATVRTFVPGGPQVGVRTLTNEEQLAFDLINSLSESQRRQAIISEKPPADYRGPGQPQPPAVAGEGLPVKSMTPKEQAQLKTLLASYCSHLAPPLAAARLARIESDGWDRAYLAWAGATQPGVGHYYRIEGPSFVLELVNIQSDPAGNPANHIHSVWRDPRGDFGTASR